MRETKQDMREKKMGIKEHLRKAMVVLLTVAMVSQQSPVVYAVENYNGSSDNESVETYTNDSNENVGSEDEANDQSDDVSDDQSDNENSDQPESIFDFFGNFFGGATGQSEEDTLDIEVQFGHSYIEYLDQVIAPPASKFKVPRDTELRFRAYADSGYEILGVSYMADGVKYDLAYDEQTDEYIVDSSLLQGTPILVVSAIEASEGELQGLSLHYLDENFLNLNDDLNVDGEDNDSNGFDESDENDNADNESNGTNSLEDVSDGEEVVGGNTDSEKFDSDEEQVEEEEQSDDTADEKKAGEEDEDEEEAEEPATRTTYEYEDRQVKVVATVEDPEAIPDSAELVVRRVTKNSEGYNYDAYMDALNEASEDMNYDDENTLLYDVAFKVPKTDEDGNVIEGEFIEIQPAEGAVTIDISFKRYQLQDKLEAKENEDVEIKHLPLVDSVREGVDSTEDATDITSSDIKVEDVDNTVDVENEMVSLTAESFSVFSVTVTNGGKATIQLQFKDKNGNATSHTINKHLYTFVKTNDNKRAILELENKGNGRYSVSFDKLEGKQLSGQTQLEADFWLTDKSNVSGTDQNAFDFNRGDIHLTNGELIDGYLLKFPQDSVIYSGDTYTVEASKDSSAMATIEFKFLDEHRAQVDQTVDGVLYAYVTSKNWTKDIFKLDKDDQGTYSTSFVKLGNTGLDDSYDLAVTLYLTPNEIQTDQPSQLTNNGGRELQDGSTVVGTYILNCPNAATFKLGQIYEFEAAPPAPSQDAESQLSGSANDFFKSILGPNLNYGIVTETFDLSEGDAETNVAAISGKCVNQTGNDLTNPVEQTFILAEVIDKFKIKEQNAYVMTPASEVSKIEGLGNCTVTFDTSRNKQELTSMVQSMLDYAANQSETLAAHQNTASLVRNSEGKYVVDLTNRGSGVFYVTINDSNVFSASFGQSEGLQIIKDDNQVIVFNITLDNPGDVWKYKLKDQGADSFITEHSHEVPSTIVYNFTNATSVPLKGSVTAIVLAPKATVTTYGTGAGWLICKNVKIASGEWHNVYQEIEQVRVGSNAFIKATKRVNNRNATSDESGFKFKLEQKDGDNWKTVQQTTNVASAINFYAVSFNEHNFTASGDSQDFIYRVSEVAESKGVGGRTITTDSKIYYVKITVSKVTTHTGNTDVTSYSASVPMYYRDEACTQAVSEAVFNNTYQGSSNKEGVFELKGNKVMVGRSFQSGDSWTFTVEAPEGTPMPENTSVTINPTTGTSAEFSFGNIVFNELQNKNHTYTYTIKETKSDKNDIVYDESQKIVKLTVSDNGGATLVVTPTDGGGQNVISDLTSYLTFTNTFVEKTSASVSKVWVDGGNQDPLRPTSVTVKLKANGADVSPAKTVVLNGNNNWSHTENNLPKKDADGNDIAYTWVEEDVPSDYRMTSNTVDGHTTITNTELTESTVVKNWKDANNGNHNRPGSVTVELKANGEGIDGMQPVTLNAGNNWTHKVENLPKYDDKGLINYTWVETSNIAGYTTPTVTKSGTTTTITNNEEKTSLTVVKNWNDDDDPDHMRPVNLTVKLMKGEALFDTVVLNKDNNWTHTYENLPVYENGQKITYTWVEDKVNVHPTYHEEAPEIDNETNTTTLTNTYTREYTSATVRKVWEDENDRRKLRPASLTVNLMNGEDVAGMVTLSESNNWTDTLPNLPKYAYGKLIDYQWQEAGLPEGYTLTSTAHDENDPTITTLTNTYNAEETELTVKKVWKDGNNQDGIRPESITVNLLENGKDSGKSVTLSEANKWEAKLSDLPVKKGGQTITYSWSEVGLPEDDSYSLTTSTAGTITTLTNTHTPETVELSVKKEWNDANNQDGIRPESVIVNLEKLVNGEYKTVDTVTLNEGNKWQGTVTGLPKKADGIEIQYRWVEVVPNGYGATYTTAEGKPNTTIVTNTHNVEKTSVSVRKVWVDGNNQDGIRPASVTAVLLADGNETNKSVTLNEANNWQGTIDNLDVYKDGEAILQRGCDTSRPSRTVL